MKGFSFYLISCLLYDEGPKESTWLWACLPFKFQPIKRIRFSLLSLFFLHLISEMGFNIFSNPFLRHNDEIIANKCASKQACLCFCLCLFTSLQPPQWISANISVLILTGICLSISLYLLICLRKRFSCVICGFSHIHQHAIFTTRFSQANISNVTCIASSSILILSSMNSENRTLLMMLSSVLLKCNKWSGR